MGFDSETIIEWFSDGVLRDFDEVMTDVSGAGAEIVAGYARDYCPQDTGALRNTIRVLPPRFTGDVAVVVEGNGDIDYGSKVELGTSVIHEVPEGGKKGTTPFMRPAQKKGEGKVKTLFQDELSRHLAEK